MDVTLRDGGYRDSWTSPVGDILETAVLMDQLSLDFVELGYASSRSEYGPNGKLDPETLQAVRQRVSDALKIVIMLFQEELDPKRVLRDRVGLFDLVRLPIRCDRRDESLDLLDYCASESIPMSINFTRASAYTTEELLSACDSVLRYSPQFIYFADSRGAMIPKEVGELVFAAKSHWPNVSFGFHAHNNLSLALANSLAAIEHGASVVDASLGGCGLGAGNLILEQLLCYRNRQSPQEMQHCASIFTAHAGLLHRLGVSPSVTQYTFSGALNVPQEAIRADSTPLSLLREEDYKHENDLSALR